MFNQLFKKFTRKPVPPLTATTPAVAVAPRIVEVTDADFATVVLANPKLTAVDFWAEWCQPCEIMAAYAEFLARDYADQLVVTALDVDANPQTAEQYTIMGLPTLLFFQNGVEVERVVGIEAYQTIQARVERLLAA